MNNNRHFDDHIRKQFSDYTPDVHPRIWEKIMAEKERRRPAGFWITLLNNRGKLMLAGLIIAISCGSAWFYVNNTRQTANTVTLNSTPDQKNQLTAPFAQVDEITENENPATQNKTDQPAGNLKYNGTANTAKVALPEPVTGSGKFIPAVLAPAEQAAANPWDKKSRSKKYHTGLGSVLVNTTAAGVEEDNDAYTTQGTLIGRLNFQAGRYWVNRKSESGNITGFKDITYFPDCPSIIKNAAGNKRYFEFYAGPDFGFRSLQDTGNSAYLQKRRESTSFKSAFSAGVRYTRVFSNSMSVRAGINFSQINEKFSYNQGNVVQVTYIINANGDTVGSYTTTGSRYKTTVNRYRTVDIPLTIGYEVGNGKLHANINAGAVVNLYSWQKGDVLDTAGNPVSITTGKGSSPYQFKTNAGVGFIGAVSVYYKLNDKLHIMAEPYFRYNFTPMNKENITLKQKYQTAGLRLGVRLDLQ